jgi:hypothetical protein
LGHLETLRHPWAEAGPLAADPRTMGGPGLGRLDGGEGLAGLLPSVRRSLEQGRAVRRITTVMPLYTLMLGLLALLGFMAIAAGVKVTNGQLAIPQLFETMFPDWFAGVAFAAIGIGALVPAPIMSIAAANLFTRNINTVAFES